MMKKVHRLRPTSQPFSYIAYSHLGLALTFFFTLVQNLGTAFSKYNRNKKNPA